MRAFATALSDLFAARVLGLVGASALLGVACFAGLWLGIDWLLAWWYGPAGTMPAWPSWLGGLVTLTLAVLLFPAVMSACLCLFLERIAAIVERRHYPALGPAPGLPLGQAVLASVRFLVLCVVVNLLLLGLWFVPMVWAVAWPVANGFLLGREYFELVALRRLDARAAAALRARHGVGVFVTGVVIALLFAVPIVNLFVPVLATALMVHRFVAWCPPAPASR
ncbi:MAG: EI24 domain-containing protein [Planctomycetota bacterium]